MRSHSASRFAVLTSLFRLGNTFNVTAANDANARASAIFGNGITVIQAQYTGATSASGLFTDGPFGIGSGAIFTTGDTSSVTGGGFFVGNGQPGITQYCGGNGQNAAYLITDVLLNGAFNGIYFDYVLASSEEIK